LRQILDRDQNRDQINSDGSRFLDSNFPGARGVFLHEIAWTFSTKPFQNKGTWRYNGSHAYHDERKRFMESLDEKEQSKRTIPSAPRPRRRPPPRPATWDQSKAISLARRGLGPSDIASVVGVHRTTVSDYLQRVLPEFKSLQPFRDRLGDSLSLALAHYTALEYKLLTLLNNEDVLSALSASEKTSLLARVAVAKAICFDKWRLRTNQSTSNNSHQIQINQVHRNLNFNPVSRKSGSSGEGPHQSPTP